jgi:hypothetical protein
MSILRRSLGIAIFCGLLFGPVAAASPTLTPRKALIQAWSQVNVLGQQASTSSVRRAAANAARELELATDPELWIDARHADAPSYGTRIFAGSAAAIRDLQRLEGSSGAAVGLIIGADRAVAEGVIAQARGGSHRILAGAKHALAAGGREAVKGRLGAAIRSYTTAWERAYAALTRLVASQATSVPPAAVAAAAEEALGTKKIGLNGPMTVQAQPPLTDAGKPELFFAGSEACPFCGVQRWGMIVALAQFGSFSNLHLMQSDPTEPIADRTFTFVGSSYRSPYISFVPVEVWSNVRRGFGFTRLQRLSPSENALLGQLDPPGVTPFIDVANQFTNLDSTVLPPLIAGMSWTQITASLRHPTTNSAQAIAGTAEVLTAEICEATGGNPQSVCTALVVKQYQAALPLLNGMGGGCPPGQMRDALVARRGAQPPRARAARCNG